MKTKHNQVTEPGDQVRQSASVHDVTSITTYSMWRHSASSVIRGPKSWCFTFKSKIQWIVYLWCDLFVALWTFSTKFYWQQRAYKMTLILWDCSQTRYAWVEWGWLRTGNRMKDIHPTESVWRPLFQNRGQFMRSSWWPTMETEKVTVLRDWCHWRRTTSATRPPVSDPGPFTG